MNSIRSNRGHAAGARVLSMSRGRLVGLVLAACAGVLGVSSTAHADAFAIRCGGYVDPDGAIQNGALVVIRDGRITQVGGDLPEGIPFVEYQGAVLSPGLIDCHAALGAITPAPSRRGQTAVAAAEVAEIAAPIEPAAAARDVFNRHHRHLRDALEAGVTTFALVPNDENLVGGRAVVAHTAGTDGAAPAVLSDGPMKLSLSPDAFKPDRLPTSRSGALELMRRVLSNPEQAGHGSAALEQLTSGQMTTFFAAPTGADVLAALDLTREYNLKSVLIHTSDARQVARVIGEQDLPVVVGPLGLHSSRRDAGAPAALAEAGVRVAIAGGLPDATADSLRIGAAVAAREGLDPAIARKAITGTPAELLGLADRGSIATGQRADLVVFSGDPVDLRSRVLAVYVDGRRVYAAGD